MTKPQNITSRYTRNLIVRGSNDDFAIARIMREANIVNDTHIGWYFTAILDARYEPRDTKSGIGATVEAAVDNALAHHGVTFA